MNRELSSLHEGSLEIMPIPLSLTLFNRFPVYQLGVLTHIRSEGKSLVTERTRENFSEVGGSNRVYNTDVCL